MSSSHRRHGALPTSTAIQRVPDCYDLSNEPTIETCEALWNSIGKDSVYFRLDDVEDDPWKHWKTGIWADLSWSLNHPQARPAAVASISVTLRNLGSRVFNQTITCRRDFQRIVKREAEAGWGIDVPQEVTTPTSEDVIIWIGEEFGRLSLSVYAKLEENVKVTNHQHREFTNRFAKFYLHIGACFLQWGFGQGHSQAFHGWIEQVIDRFKEDGNKISFKQAMSIFESTPLQVGEAFNKVLPDKFKLRFWFVSSEDRREAETRPNFFEIVRSSLSCSNGSLAYPSSVSLLLRLALDATFLGFFFESNTS
ncbi:uncharacterized protein JCM6883_000925 [Sporobolomyces salmoneus]|uniref:uncharacterized protein n=1 Tax=Sporobolomyces salmoneus TaxID=183962 RepID=UPI0031746F1B